MNGAVFRLSHPILGQTHGKLYDRHQPFAQGSVTITYDVGKIVAREFIPEPQLKQATRTLAGAELEAFLDFVMAQGQPELLRGQFRDSDIGDWFALGPWTPPVEVEG